MRDRIYRTTLPELEIFSYLRLLLIVKQVVCQLIYLPIGQSTTYRVTGVTMTYLVTLMRSCPLFFISFAVLLAAANAASGWSYEKENGPATWSNSYPECGGSYQSPINIDISRTVLTNANRPIWIDYDRDPRAMNLTNNGHSIELTGSGNGVPRLHFGRDDVYNLVGVHFHWGKNRSGSEHTFNNKRYSLEMHAVHRRARNGVLIEPPQIIVVTKVFQEGNTNDNNGLEQFIHHVERVRSKENSLSIKPFVWSRLIPQFHSGFYYYKGSLTTPPCSEVVTFMIQDYLYSVSTRAMDTLRTVPNDEGHYIAGNFRPVQPLNGRTVYYVR